LLVIAIVPAKSQSERIPAKNTKLLNGAPLIQYTIDAAKESNCFDHIWITSEDYNLLKRIPEDTEGHLRPQSLATPTATVFDVCKDLLGVYGTTSKRHDFGLIPESFAVLLPTSPLRTVDDIQQAVKLFNESGCESVMSVTELDHPPEHALRTCDCGKLHSLPTIGKKRQELTPKYRHDGSIIICDTEAFLQVDDFYDLDTVPLEIPRERAVDINTMADWDYCEWLMGER
jgi:CMP-N-acetylneuraminic acid synthetase